MKFRCSNELARSGTEWLGRTPNTWRTRPLRSMYRRIKDTDHPGEQMLSVFREHGVVVKESYENNNQTAEDRSIYQLVHPGWLVANRMKAWQGAVGISSYRGIVSGHYICFAPRHVEDDRYLNWLFRSDVYTRGYALISRGVRTGQAEIDNSKYGAVPVLLPSVSEQGTIADYLDRETAQIDALIGKQERLIEMLRERRAAAISSACAEASSTRVPLRRLVEVVDCAHLTAEFVETDRHYPVASIRECQRGEVDLGAAAHTTRYFFDLLREGQRQPRPGDLLFVRNVSVGLVAVVPPGAPDFAVGQETVLLRRRAQTDPAFLRYALVSAEVRHEIDKAMIGSTFRRINVSAIRSLPVPSVPLQEQRRIVEQLDRACMSTDALIATAEQFITLARERRSALITAAVTGQIDVGAAS